MGLLREAHRTLASIPRAAHRKCILCGHRVGRFLPFTGIKAGLPPLMCALEMVGSDVENFECPRCGAHDRERHLFLYLHESGLLDRFPTFRILHFAPEVRLAQKFKNLAPIAYVKCDLHPTAEDIRRINIEAMPFADRAFSLVIANHVLEHVADDIRAVAEIRRVLCPDGFAILQTPYAALLQHTWSDPGIDSDAARLQAYGQEDHVRLFGRDIFERFASSGLEPCMETHSSLLAKYDANQFGVNEAEPFFLFRRVD